MYSVFSVGFFYLSQLLVSKYLDMHSIHSSDKDFKTGQMFILRHIFISVITRQPIKSGVTLLHSTTTYLGTYICRAQVQLFQSKTKLPHKIKEAFFPLLLEQNPQKSLHTYHNKTIAMQFCCSLTLMITLCGFMLSPV